MDEQQQMPPAQIEQRTPAPKRGKKLFLGLVGVLLVAAVAASTIFLMKDRQEAKTEQTDETSQTAIVEITDEGFVPQTLKVAPGTEVTWLNKTRDPCRVASNPYPELSDLPGLDSHDPIGPDEKYRYTFSDPGTFGYHNYFEPTTNGEVIVE